MMNKHEYPCVPMPEDETYYFDDCQHSFVYAQVVNTFLYSFFNDLIPLMGELGCVVPWISDFVSQDSFPKICNEDLAEKSVELYFKYLKSGISLN